MSRLLSKASKHYPRCILALISRHSSALTVAAGSGSEQILFHDPTDGVTKIESSTTLHMGSPVEAKGRRVSHPKHHNRLGKRRTVFES